MTHQSPRDNEQLWQTWKTSRQGAWALDHEQRLARREKREYNETDVRDRFLAACHDRPRRGKAAGDAWIDFQERYDLLDPLPNDPGDYDGGYGSSSYYSHTMDKD